MKYAAIMFSMLMGVSSVFSQEAVISFKKLKDYLPQQAPAGFTADKPRGETTSAMGMSSSYAEITMNEEQAENPRSINVKITDMKGIPMASAMTAVFDAGVSTETDTGYEKSVKYKEYAGLEKSESDGEYKNCSLQFFVANRFLVEITGNQFNDTALLYTVADGINLKGLQDSGI